MVGKIAVVAVNSGPALALYVDAESDGVVAVHVGGHPNHRPLLRPQPAEADLHRLPNPLTLR
jgi:hypothetical protein